MAKKTAWFAASVKPIKKGWYEVSRGYVGVDEKMPAHMLEWTGKEWRYAYRFKMASVGDFAVMSESHGDKWRGLAAPK